jgi:uncharacterized protein YnzC (UPF0291/DUF896 family)
MTSELLARLEWQRAYDLMEKYDQTPKEVALLDKARRHLIREEWDKAYREAFKVTLSVIKRVDKTLASKEAKP